MEAQNAQSTGDKIVGDINQVVRYGSHWHARAGHWRHLAEWFALIATAVRPSDAQKAQAFDDAIAGYDAAAADLSSAIAGFEAAKAAAQGVSTPAPGASSAAGSHSEG